MNIFGTQYTLSQRAYEIYISGCSGNPKHCEGCHSPHTWDFEAGSPFNEDFMRKVKADIRTYDSLIDSIMIFGGEPLDQPAKELEFLLIFCNTFKKQIWLFTHYEPDDAFDRFPSLHDLCDFVKFGSYIPELKSDTNTQYGIRLATSNQHIIKYNRKEHP